MASRFSVEYWHFARDDVEVTEWLVDSTLSSSTPSRCGLASRLCVEYWHSDQDEMDVTEWLVHSTLSTSTPSMNDK